MPVLRTPASAARVLGASPGWLTLIALLAVAAVNLAGFWGIRVARQGARDEAARAFELEVGARASRLERRLSEVRADLAFLASSPTIARLGDEGLGPSSLTRQAAESALLIFLRSHAEVVRISIASTAGRPLVHVGRRGGVPVLWVSASPTGDEGAAVDPRRPRLIAKLPQQDTGRPLAGGVTVEIEVEAGSLLDPGEGAPSSALAACELADATGATLGRFPRGPRASSGATGEETRAAVPAEGWSAAGPLRLSCRRASPAASGLDEPIFARYRTTLALNLAVMALALLLGGFAVQQARSRAGLEARAAEEARVRELERRLFHAERLSTVGRLAAGIAHEINNPLEGMANYLALARDASARGDSEAVGRHLAAIKQGLDRAAGIVRQVLAHADPAKAEMTPVDVNRVLRETGDFVRSRREFTHVELAYELGPGPLLVRGSPVMLGQVAMNLIVNACEAQPTSGEVRVVSRAEAGQVVVEFQDRGPGIAEADRERVFEPFFSTKDSTGLGLSICHTIVAQHGGELSAEPRPGGGTLFRMRLKAWEGGA
ncbi:MAG TPA: ATP-binding protein [Vicinamibacteria bacterium]|nr:ATP-binding protein [Vicinamibacteria bacterium]